MRTYMFFIVSLISFSACQDDAPDYTRTETEEPELVEQSEPIKETDSIDEVPDTQVNLIPEDQNTLVEDIPIKTIDVEIHIPDPFEDPDYIGTPCGDYVNGRCTRHSHHKDEMIEEPFFEIEHDSLRH